jgi:gluconate 2-dehydrogenase gamma chain
LTEAYPKLVPLYRNGCRALDRHAKGRFGAGFLRVTTAHQDEVLTDFEAGKVAGFNHASEFFETLRRHTMEGVLGEPAYGGNQGLVGWRLVGFPGHQYGYKDAYINKLVDIEPIAVDRPYRTEEEWNANAR